MFFHLKVLKQAGCLIKCIKVSVVPLLAVALCMTLFASAHAKDNGAPVKVTAENSDEVVEKGQDRETQALDSTATQWSFQFAYQGMPDYHRDTMDNGQIRPEGNKEFFQLRIVAPLTQNQTGLPFTILPRLTMRYEQNQVGKWGLGNTELFALGIIQDWGTGRWGLGPLVNVPAATGIGGTSWGAGFAGAVVNGSGDWFYGLLFTQSWNDTDKTLPDKSGAAPLGIAPIVNYKLSNGWYLSNGDMTIRWDWDASALYVPIGIRVGKVFVGEKSSWNFYGEYQTSLVYDDWLGSAVENSFRINATYTIPVK